MFPSNLSMGIFKIHIQCTMYIHAQSFKALLLFLHVSHSWVVPALATYNSLIILSTVWRLQLQGQLAYVLHDCGS